MTSSTIKILLTFINHLISMGRYGPWLLIKMHCLWSMIVESLRLCTNRRNLAKATFRLWSKMHVRTISIHSIRVTYDAIIALNISHFDDDLFSSLMFLSHYWRLLRDAIIWNLFSCFTLSICLSSFYIASWLTLKMHFIWVGLLDKSIRYGSCSVRKCIIFLIHFQ